MCGAPMCKSLSKDMGGGVPKTNFLKINSFTLITHMPDEELTGWAHGTLS
jgi:hypothetical protein